MFMYGGVLHLDTLLGTNATGWLWYGSGSTKLSKSSGNPSAVLETTASCLNFYENFADFADCL